MLINGYIRFLSGQLSTPPFSSLPLNPQNGSMDAVNHIKLRVERSAAAAVLRALLLAIFFHRNLDGIEPYTLDIHDTHVAVVAGPGGDEAKSGSPSAVEREISSKVDEFVRTIVDSEAGAGEVRGRRVSH